MDTSHAERPLVPATLEAIRQFDTCTVANAIETLGLRLRNEGYTNPGLRCVTGGSERIIGYAATSRVKTSNPPVSGTSYYDRWDWRAVMESMPVPRIAVIQDIDERPGLGSVAGEVHAAILQAQHCAGLITNGSVRDVPGLTALGFPVYACHVTISHGYCHLVDFGQSVQVSGLGVAPGDLLLADCHGVLSIPREGATDLPRIAAEITSKERRIVDLCKSPEFTVDKLYAAIREIEKLKL
jgi:regulator of RNase E activity RraA